MEALFWKDVGMVMISLQPWASDWYWICTVKTQKKGFQASITSNNWIQCWSILLNFSSCLPLHLHHPEDFFVLIYNFQFSVIWENRAGGKQGRNWWRGMPENRLVEKERTEKTRRQKIQETEGILILDYVAKRPSIRLQMRCVCEQIRSQRGLLWESFQEIMGSKQAKNGMRNKIWEVDDNELDEWTEYRRMGINLRSPEVLWEENVMQLDYKNKSDIGILRNGV